MLPNEKYNIDHFYNMEKNHEVKIFTKGDSSLLQEPQYIIAKKNKAGDEVYLCFRISMFYPYEVEGIYWHKDYDKAKRFNWEDDAISIMHGTHKKSFTNAYVYCVQEQEVHHTIAKGYRVDLTSKAQ